MHRLCNSPKWTVNNQGQICPCSSSAEDTLFRRTSQPKVMFSLSDGCEQHWEEEEEEEAACFWSCRWCVGLVWKRAHFILFFSKLLFWTNVFYIIWASVWVCEIMCECVSSWAGYNPPDQNLKLSDLNQRQAFSHRSTCWDTQMEKGSKRWIDQVRLVTPSLPDFHKRNLQKGINSPGWPAVFNREKLFYLYGQNHFLALTSPSWIPRALALLQ